MFCLSKKNFLLILFGVIAKVFLVYEKNEVYGAFYSALSAKNYILYYLFIYLALAFMTFLVDLFIGLLKNHLINKNKKNLNLIDINLQTLTQNVLTDQKLIAENYITFLEKIIFSSCIFLFFVPKLFWLTKNNFNLLTFSIFYIYILFLFNYKMLKKYYNFYYSNSLKDEGILRDFLNSWFSFKKILPIPFQKKLFNDHLDNIRKFEVFKIFYDSIKELLSTIGLFMPFFLFYHLYCQNDISFGLLMQIINIWTQINYAAAIIEDAIEHYLAYKISKNRLNIEQKETKHFNCLKIENLSIQYDNISLIKNFNLKCEMNEKINIIGEHGSGKTSIMKALKNQIQYSGEIVFPKRTIFIPENFTLPKFFLFDQTDNFIKNCKLLEVNHMLIFENASGSEKWRLVAAYALDFDFIIWDDPFWGESVMFQRFFDKMNAGLIFSKMPIEGFKILNIADLKK